MEAMRRTTVVVPVHVAIRPVATVQRCQQTEFQYIESRYYTAETQFAYLFVFHFQSTFSFSHSFSRVAMTRNLTIVRQIVYPSEHSVRMFPWIYECMTRGRSQPQSGRVGILFSFFLSKLAQPRHSTCLVPFPCVVLRPLGPGLTRSQMSGSTRGRRHDEVE